MNTDARANHISPLSLEESGEGASIADLVYRRLKAAIRHREFKPGDRMREADLANRLSVSRTPVRDALKQLEVEGLLVSARRRGLVVAELNHQQVSEIYALRTALEGLAARMSARHATSAEVATMREAIRRHEENIAEDEWELAELNRSFHFLIYRAARNRYLLEVLEMLESTLALLPGTTYSHPEFPSTALAEHKAIVDAIEDHDGDLAEEAARRHILGSEKVRMLMMSDPR